MKKILIQAALFMIAALIVYLMRPVAVIYEAGRWFLLPALGLCSAYMCTRRGINPYLAWITPPVAMIIAGFIAQGGYLPAFGAVLLTAFISVAGAATGDTLNHYKHRKHK